MKITHKSAALNEEALLTSMGNAISKRRLKLGLSQEQVARSADLTRSYLSDIERGLRNVTLLTLSGIAAALLCSCTDILNDADKMRRLEQSDKSTAT